MEEECTTSQLDC